MQTDILTILNSDDEKAKVQFIFDACESSPHASDLAVVLGCGTEAALRRAEMAANFYLKGYTKLIIASGGVYHDYKGESKTECAIMRERLIEKGVPSGAITEETNSQTTIGNMVFSLGELCRKGFLDSDFNSVTIITEPYHLRRSLLLARTYFPKFIKIYGYTEGSDEQKSLYATDSETRKCVDNEISILKQLIENGRVVNEK